MTNVKLAERKGITIDALDYLLNEEGTEYGVNEWLYMPYEAGVFLGHDTCTSDVCVLLIPAVFDEQA